MGEGRANEHKNKKNGIKKLERGKIRDHKKELEGKGRFIHFSSFVLFRKGLHERQRMNI